MTLRKTAAMAALLLLGAATVSVYGQEAGINPARGAALQRQLDLEKGYAQLQIDDKYLQLAIPGQTMGETMGVDTNSKGHLFVYTRTENQGIARGGKAAKLFEFDQNYKFVKEWGMNNYSESFAHEVKVDKQDNVWSVDEGSGMVIKFNPAGQHIFWLGRTPEAIDYLEANLEILHYAHAAQAAPPKPVGRMGTFDRETGIAWDKAGNIFVSDGYGNSRFVKISPDGHWLKAVGTFGSGPLQFNTPHDIAVDASDNVYVADRGNNRIQVFDDNMNHLRDITGVGAPWALCFSDASPQVMYSGDGTGKVYRLNPADGKVTGMFITGQDHGTEDTGNLIHSLSCKKADTVFIGSASMWDVQKVTVK